LKKGSGQRWLHRFNQQLAWNEIRLSRSGTSYYWVTRYPRKKKSFSILRHGYERAFQLAARAAGLVPPGAQLSTPQAPAELQLHAAGGDGVGRQALMRFNTQLRSCGIAIRAGRNRHWWVDRSSGTRLVFAGRHYRDTFQEALAKLYAPERPPKINLPELPPDLEAAVMSQTPPAARTSESGPAWYLKLNQHVGLRWLKLRRWSSGHYFWQITIPRGTKLGTQSFCIRTYGYKNAFDRAVKAWAAARKIQPPALTVPPCPPELSRYLRDQRFVGAKRQQSEVRLFNEQLQNPTIQLHYYTPHDRCGYHWVVFESTQPKRNHASFSVQRYGFDNALMLAVKAHNELFEIPIELSANTLPPLPLMLTDYLINHDTAGYRLAQAVEVFNNNPAKITLSYDKWGWFLTANPRHAGEKVVRRSLVHSTFRKTYIALIKLRDAQTGASTAETDIPRLPETLKAYVQKGMKLPVKESRASTHC
ncbi:MAG: hypothetical protein ACR2RB_01340, partial [Gammaproteobacteria bacterium]